jgi:hypothetical protein
METSHSQLTQMDMYLFLVSNYLNTSLSCIRNHYNRHPSQMQKGLTLLQPISGQMGDAFKEFQNSISVSSTDELQDNNRWKRYVRRTLWIKRCMKRNFKSGRMPWRDIARRMHHVLLLKNFMGKDFVSIVV